MEITLFTLKNYPHHSMRAKGKDLNHLLIELRFEKLMKYLEMDIRRSERRKSRITSNQRSQLISREDFIKHNPQYADAFIK